MAKNQFNVRLDEELITFLTEQSKKEYRTASSLLHSILYDYKNKMYPKSNSLTNLKKK